MRQTPGDSIETTPVRPSRRKNLVAAVSFVLGGSLFALGAVLAQLDVGRLVTVNVTYLVGGFFFSLGGYVSILLAPPHQRQRHSAVVLFVGTLLFAVSLVAAFAEGLTPRQSNGWIWLPDILGCVCFLVSGHLAMLEVGAGRIRVRPRVLDWWVVAVNQLGSILFFLAGHSRLHRVQLPPTRSTSASSTGGPSLGRSVSHWAESFRHSIHPLQQER